MRDRQPCVYILASTRNGTLYVGVTADLPARLQQHRDGLAGAFTTHYQVHLLVWYERHEEMATAIVREKAIKRWRQVWKLRLVEGANPYWRDLANDFVL